MRIAVSYEKETETIFLHFGRTAFFKIYDVVDNTITAMQIVDTNGQGHGALVGVLHELKADVLLCGGIGAGAQAALHEAGIQLYGGCSGNADQAIRDFLAGKLAYQEDVHCEHHDGECGHEAGTCGHGCHPE